MPAAIATYSAALLLGLTLVSFPALSVVLRQLHGFSEAQYGAIFLPQVALAVVGAVGGGIAAARIGLKILLIAGVAFMALSQLALVWSVHLPPTEAYSAILGGTAALGLGFGLFGAPWNSLPPLLFPGRRNAALVAAHAMAGLGLTLGPLYAAIVIAHETWLAYPLTVLALAAALILFTLFVPLPKDHSGSVKRDGESTVRPVRTALFWMLVAIAVLYAFAEGTFASWVVVYLKESKSLPEDIATLSLSVFWGALVGARLLSAVLLVRVSPEAIWRILPVFMALAFLCLPYADSPLAAIGVFAFAGIACSAFFPITVAIALRHFPRDIAWVSSMLVAALMLGVGIGSFAVGALRASLFFENLYRISAAYPLIALALILIVLRPSAGRQRGATP